MKLSKPLTALQLNSWAAINAYAYHRTLTDTKLTDLDSLRRALTILHETHRVPHVVMSSMPLHDFFCAALPPNLLPADVVSREPGAIVKSHLICISSSYVHPSRRLRAPAEPMSTTDDGAENVSTVHAHVLPCVPGYYSGVGDLFSALLLAHYREMGSVNNGTRLILLAPNIRSDYQTSVIDLGSSAHSSNSTSLTPLSTAASFALSKTVGILRLTHAHVSALPADASVARDGTDEERDRLDPERRVRRQRARELRLIQGQDILRNVPVASPSDFSKTAELRELRPWQSFWSNL